MKINELKSLIESSVRRVVREELDYRFDKLNEQLTLRTPSRESNSKSNKAAPAPQERPSSGKFQESREFFRKKFGDIFDDIEPFNESVETPSILDEGNLKTLASSNRQGSVLKALTRDYTDIVRAMDNL